MADTSASSLVAPVIRGIIALRGRESSVREASTDARSSMRPPTGPGPAAEGCQKSVCPRVHAVGDLVQSIRDMGFHGDDIHRHCGEEQVVHTP